MPISACCLLAASSLLLNCHAPLNHLCRLPRRAVASGCWHRLCILILCRLRRKESARQGEGGPQVSGTRDHSLAEVWQWRRARPLTNASARGLAACASTGFPPPSSTDSRPARRGCQLMALPWSSPAAQGRHGRHHRWGPAAAWRRRCCRHRAQRRLDRCPVYFSRAHPSMHLCCLCFRLQRALIRELIASGQEWQQAGRRTGGGGSLCAAVDASDHRLASSPHASSSCNTCSSKEWRGESVHCCCCFCCSRRVDRGACCKLDPAPACWTANSSNLEYSSNAGRCDGSWGHQRVSSSLHMQQDQ